ncbi:MAG: TrkA family potassium uptake protein [Ruminococcus sp.]|nr:TrkA family potassium uptake protein [Ruminococcus sp.]
MKKQQEMLYGIIGLGRFGYALAKNLAEAGKDLIIVDENASKINSVSEFTPNAYITQDLSKENLMKIGLQNCDVVVVCIGEKIDTCILTTLNVIQMGVPKVIAKATSEEQGCVLQLIGAEVVYPERDMGLRLANRLTAPGFLELFALNDSITISEIALTKKADSISVANFEIRKKFGLNMIAIRHGENLNTDITPETMLYEDDVIIVIGKKENVKCFEEYLRSKR